MKIFNEIVEFVEANENFKLESLNDLLDVMKEEYVNSRNDGLYEEIKEYQKNLLKNLNNNDELFVEMRRVAWVFENIGYDFLSDRQQDSYKDIIYILLTK